MSSQDDTKPKILLKKNKNIDQIWHVESTLVFRSAKDRVVIGRCSDNTFVPLDQEAIDMCAEWGFKYDHDLLNKDDEEENDNQEEEEEEEQDEKQEEEEENTPQPTKKQSKVVEEPEPAPKKQSKVELAEESEPAPKKQSKVVLAEESEPAPKKQSKVVESANKISDRKETINRYLTDSMTTLTPLLHQLVTELETQLHQELSSHKVTEKLLNDTRKELEETKTKFDNIKKMLGCS